MWAVEYTCLDVWLGHKRCLDVETGVFEYEVFGYTVDAGGICIWDDCCWSICL